MNLSEISKLELFKTVKVLHIESTNICQAACPSCARETDKTFLNEISRSLSVTDIQNLLSTSVISQLEKMFMCGNYGDPAANSQSIDIFSYFRNINNNIVLGMNTNGGLQNKSWWQNLASILVKKEDYVVFSIDGLKDTNHIYRKNVNWNVVMQNVESFINAGGNAHWDMLVYEHNEHQVDECETLAKNMGFKWFRAKVSQRVPTVEWLKMPRTWKRPNITHGPIRCFRNQEESIYLSAKGIFHPCCWLGTGNYTIENFDHIKSSWNTSDCNDVCKKICSINENKTNFINQWQRSVELC